MSRRSPWPLPCTGTPGLHWWAVLLLALCGQQAFSFAGGEEQEVQTHHHHGRHGGAGRPLMRSASRSSVGGDIRLDVDAGGGISTFEGEAVERRASESRLRQGGEVERSLPDNERPRMLPQTEAVRTKTPTPDRQRSQSMTTNTTDGTINGTINGTTEPTEALSGATTGQNVSDKEGETQEFQATESLVPNTTDPLSANSSYQITPPERVIVTGGVDKTTAISTNSVLITESKLFAVEKIARERAALCPHISASPSFTVLSATVQASASIVASMNVYFGQGERQTIVVEWTVTAGDPASQSALAQVQLMLSESGGVRVGLIDGGAKLLLPASPCLLGVTDSSFLAGAGGENAAAIAVPPTRRPTFGVIVERELEAYQAGLAQQGVRVAQAPHTSAPFPASHNWKTVSPSCFDYVHNQGDCGACYMFAALDSLSDRSCLNLNQESTLGAVHHISVQMGLMCEPAGRQCAGGWADIAFNYSAHTGLTTEESWPFERLCLSSSVCQFGSVCHTMGSTMCDDVFTVAELDKIRNYEDALALVKARCEALPLKDSCKTWATSKFGNHGSQEFQPERAFCEALKAGLDDFEFKGLLEESSLEQEDEGEAMSSAETGQTGQRDKGKWWFFSRRRRTEDTATSAATSVTVTPGAATATDTVTTTVSTSVEVAVSLTQCNRDRCQSETGVHSQRSYYYIINTKDSFKYEVYLSGPFYTSYYIHEDFTWFFSLYPLHAYSTQWGQSLGGHAVVLIGWEPDCVYHDGASLIQEEEEDDEAGAEVQRAMGGHRTFGSRRRTAKAECWYLRNTWGETWADQGYFRMKDDMLTGPEGTHLHIASVVADRPRSLE